MMTEIPVPPKEEQSIGMGFYLTDNPPIGGRLKKSPEDFIVNEISIPPTRDDEGKYTIARVKVYNWETNRLIRAFSRRFGISKKRIGFAGTKDKRAVTTQLISFQCDEQMIIDSNIKDVYIIDTYRSNKSIRMGDLQGNNFQIRIRDLFKPKEELEKKVEAVLGDISEIGGFPNYFGVQRFGAIRPITHLVGMEIVRGNLEKAVMIYIGNPYPMESHEAREARTRLELDRDYNKALESFPVDYIFERTLLTHLSKNGEDWAGAISCLPENLRMMFIHAYQSFIFNKILTQRNEHGIPLNEPILGDILIPLNKIKLPDRHRYIKVDKKNLSKMTYLVEKGMAFISGLVVGFECEFANGEMGEIERTVIENEKLNLSDFVIPEINGISSRGMRRELLSPVFNLKWKISYDSPTRLTKKGERKGVIELDFSLFRGTYATSFLRELIKGKVTDY